MKRNELATIAKHFSAYEVRFSDEGDGFDILNPYGKDPISVYVEDEQGKVTVQIVNNK